MRKVCSLSLLAVLVLSLGLTLGLFGRAEGDDCSACAGHPCSFLCASCACCAATLSSIGAAELTPEARGVAATPHLVAAPLSADPRGILHVPRPA